MAAMLHCSIAAIKSKTKEAQMGRSFLILYSATQNPFFDTLAEHTQPCCMPNKFKTCSGSGRSRWQAGFNGFRTKCRESKFENGTGRFGHVAPPLEIRVQPGNRYSTLFFEAGSSYADSPQKRLGVSLGL